MGSRKIQQLILATMFLVFLIIAIHFIAGRADDGSYVMTGAVVAIILFLLFGLLLVAVHRGYRLSEQRLNSILDSTTEAIIGLNLQGVCTFVNTVGVDLLGYQSDREMIGRDIHDLVHHSVHDQAKPPADRCELFRALREQVPLFCPSDVFQTRSGHPLPVEYHLNPQMNKRKMIGMVMTFIDITERQKAREREQYHACHDAVTGLYNRTFLLTEIDRLNVERNLPFSMIVGDVNGLKLTNDVFGHEAGDGLLRLIGEAIRRACRADDIIARISGDEFVILLPHTPSPDAKAILRRIRKEVEQVRYQAVYGSIALGQATRSRPGKSSDTLFAEAEDAMYQDKTVHQKQYQTAQLQHMIETLHNRSPREKLHSDTVSRLCGDIAAELAMTPHQVRQMKDAGYYHDIGKIALSDAILAKIGRLSPDEQLLMQRHPATGYRILNLFHETMDIAQGALDHHERWDGGGYPKGLKGEEISLAGRIIAVAEAYDFGTNPHSTACVGQDKTLDTIRCKAGTKYDPTIVEALKRAIS